MAEMSSKVTSARVREIATITVKITVNERKSAPGKLAKAEVQFHDDPIDGRPWSLSGRAELQTDRLHHADLECGRHCQGERRSQKPLPHTPPDYCTQKRRLLIL
jgi:hypothetical protein